jgi:hypothetical protein
MPVAEAIDFMDNERRKLAKELLVMAEQAIAEAHCSKAVKYREAARRLEIVMADLNRTADIIKRSLKDEPPSS